MSWDTTRDALDQRERARVADIPTVPLDFFLGTQRLTHVISTGQTSIIGIDDVLYKFTARSEQCPLRTKLISTPSYDAYGYSNYAPNKTDENGHNRYCTRVFFDAIRALDAEDVNALEMVIELNARRFERMVTFYKHPEWPLLYGIDESWDSPMAGKTNPASGKIIIELGERDMGPHGHQRFAFYINSDGYVPSWMRAKPLDVDEGSL